MKTAAFCAAALPVLASCKDDAPDALPAQALDAPSVTLAAEKTADPIVLEFAWSAVENAGSYEYKLERDGALVTEGKSDAASLEIAASQTVSLAAGTEYVFSVRALPADAERYGASDWGTAPVSTGPAPARALDAPSVTLAAEKSANPIVLEFAWSAVENAGSYEYKLEGGGALVTEGATGGTALEIAAAGDVAVTAGTEYVFSVRALPADAERYAASDWGAASVATEASAFRLSVENVTYRTADMMCLPADPMMKYGLSQITLARYNEYPDDETFYEQYEKGYYRMVGQQLGAPWYMVMESMMTTGDYGYHTGALAPETDYLLYAYGIKAMVEEFDIALVTPILKVPFRTPAWEATEDCRFDIDVAEVSAQRIAIDVTPEKNGVAYYFGVVPCSVAEQNYGGDMAALTRDILYQQEAINKVDWTNTDLLHTGTLTFTFGADEIAGMQSGEKYFALAFGVDARGLQTTELSQAVFDVPGTASQAPRRGSVQGVPVLSDRAFVSGQAVAHGAFRVEPPTR